MIRNVRLKKILVNGLFPAFSVINRIVPKRDNFIMIYCANDELNDNSAAIYDYFIENKYNSQFKIYISGANKNTELTKYPQRNCIFISKPAGIIQYMRSKYVFYSMGKMPIRPTKDQMVINLCHGIPFKTIGKRSNGKEFFFTYVCASSELYRPIMAKAFGCPEKNVCICGEPKADRLFLKKQETTSYKIVVWAPTFRQSKFLGYDDSNMESFLPFIDNSEWESFNDVLRGKSIKIIAKLHGAQNLNGFTEKIYSNFEVYSDKSFKEHGYDLYNVLSQSDALLADYSSVFLEYLVLNRPIGFTLSDMNEYENARGFVFENPLDYMPGMKIYCKEQLYNFLDSIKDTKDEYGVERERIINLIHYYKDGRNCERIIRIAGIEKNNI